MTKISFDVDFSQDPEKILKEIQKRAEAEVAKRESKEKESSYLSKLHEVVNKEIGSDFKNINGLIRALTKYATPSVRDKMLTTSSSGRRKTVSMDKSIYDQIRSLLAQPNCNKAAIARESGVSVVQVRKVADGGYDKKFAGLVTSGKLPSMAKIEEEPSFSLPPITKEPATLEEPSLPPPSFGEDQPKLDILEEPAPISPISEMADSPEDIESPSIEPEDLPPPSFTNDPAPLSPIESVEKAELPPLSSAEPDSSDDLPPAPSFEDDLPPAPPPVEESFTEAPTDLPPPPAVLEESISELPDPPSFGEESAPIPQPEESLPDVPAELPPPPAPMEETPTDLPPPPSFGDTDESAELPPPPPIPLSEENDEDITISSPPETPTEEFAPAPPPSPGVAPVPPATPMPSSPPVPTSPPKPSLAAKSGKPTLSLKKGKSKTKGLKLTRPPLKKKLPPLS